MTIAVARPPRFPPARLAELGYPLVIEAQAGMLAAYAAVRRGYEQIQQQGYIEMDPEELRRHRAEMDELVGLPALWAVEERTTERPERLPRQ